MDPRELKTIMSQGAIRPETPRDREEQRVLEEDLAESPVKGKPLRRRYRNFRPDPNGHLLAAGGPTAWMRRLRAIQEETEEHERRLEQTWRELAEETESADEFARRWRDVARGWSFYKLNRLVADHNRNFPAEARLPMDPRTRDFVRLNGRHYQREPFGTKWILERFPPDRERATIET
jgi:hypothetical protein